MALAAAQFIPLKAHAQSVTYTDGDVNTAPVLDAGTTLTVNGSDTATQAGAITGTGVLTKAGDGTLIITANSTFGGAGSPTLFINAGTLAVESGAQVTNLGSTDIAGGTSLIVSGAGSSLSGGYTISGGTGTIVVTDGAQFNTDTLGGPLATPATTIITVTGAGSVINAPSNSVLGRGTLSVLDGATFNAGNVFEIAPVAGSAANLDGATAEVLVSGGTLNTTGNVNLAPSTVNTGNPTTGTTGTLTINDGGVVSLNGGAGTLNIATTLNNFGTLNIGGDTGQAAAAAGTLQAASIQFGAGHGVINFNETDTTTFSVPINGTGFINQIGTGTTILTGISNFGFTGSTGITVSAGTLAVADGGQVTTTAAIVQGGTLTVDGSGSSLTASSLTTSTAVANINVTDGAVLSTGSAGIGGTAGTSNGGTGTVTISGAGSNWTTTGLFILYKGTVSVLDGGALSTGTFYIDPLLGTAANVDNAMASVLVSGGTLQTTGVINLAATGLAGADPTGTLTIANGGTVSVEGGAGAINVATHAGATGIINIGGVNGGPAAASGTLQAASINFGPGTGILNFNEIDQTGFTVPLIGNGTINQIGPGTTTLTGDQSSFTGTTNVSAGTLAVDGTLGGTANVQAGGILAGNGQVGPVTNAGTVMPGHDGSGILTVAGDYAGSGGTLAVASVLGGDGSATGELVVQGATSGTTQVAVTNRGGIGAVTTDGIRIVDVGGASNGSFTLKGDYTFNGRPAVIAGAYGYQLFKNGIATPTDGDWYLRSTLVEDPVDPVTGDPVSGDPAVASGLPLFQPGVPVYQAYAGTLQALNGLPSLQQRVGNRSWSGAPADASLGLWVRLDGNHQHDEPVVSTAHASSDIDTWQMQAGADATLRQWSDGSKLVGGFTFHYGNASNSIDSPFSNGAISTSGYGIGPTLTWYGANGLYVDGQAQVSWYDSTLSSNAVGRLAGGADAVGDSFSTEIGKRIPLGGSFSLTPQMQLIYSNVDFSQFTDPFGATVSDNNSDSLRTRWGVAIDHQASVLDPGGKTRRVHVYGIANVNYEWLNGSSVDVSGTRIADRDPRLWGELGLGGSLSLGNGRVTLYAEASTASALADFGDSYAFGGTAGVRMAF